MKQIESDFVHPALKVTTRLLRDHFASDIARQRRPLRNVHHETEVSEQVKATARPAAVLISFVLQENGELALLLTRRHKRIRFAGHICFPGGHRDEADNSFEETALREAEEEINLSRTSVEVLGRLGLYYTQSGYQIVPVVALVNPPLDLRPHPDEVDEIMLFPADLVFRADAYELHETEFNKTQFNKNMTNRAHFSLTYQDARVAGPTVSMMMGLYEELLRSRKST
jgi:8-oxo-dGTP pyrophosphatase MutT (NUDIX family)